MTPHCLVATLDSQLPSPKSFHKMPLKEPLPQREGFSSSLSGRDIARQLSGRNFLAGFRCLSGPSAKGWGLKSSKVRPLSSKPGKKNKACPWDLSGSFPGMSQTPGRVQKVCANKDFGPQETSKERKTSEVNPDAALCFAMMVSVFFCFSCGVVAF